MRARFLPWICWMMLALVLRAGAQDVRLPSGDSLGFTAQGGWKSAAFGGRSLPLVAGAPVLTVCDVERGPVYQPLTGEARSAEGAVEMRLDSRELALQAVLKVVPDGAAFKWQLRLTDRSGRDRGLLVRVGIPVDAVGWQWWRDLEQRRVIESGRHYEDTQPLRAFAALPEWKDQPDLRMGFNTANFCSVITGPTGLCLAIPLDQPRLFRTAYDARQKQFSLTYDVALCADTAPPSAATFEFELFGCDPAWGLRGALDTYYRRHPGYFAKHTKDEGMWVAFTRLDTLDNVTEFGVGFQEGAGSVGYDDRLGIASFSYYTHAGIYADVPGHRRGLDPTPSLERRIAAVEASLKRSTGREGVYAECGLHDATGKLSAEAGTVYGDVLAQFCLEPELFYGRWLLDRIDNFFTDFRKRGELDGFYYDGLTTGINYRREHFRHAAYPPSWDPVARKPYLYNYFSSVEWARHVADKLHKAGKWTMMNGAMGASPFCAPYLDVMGAETGLDIPHADFHFARMVCHHKTFATLLKGNYATLTSGDIERFMKRCLAYGVFPGFFDWPPSGLGPGGCYWDHPEYYERDRRLFRQYQPLVKAIAAAGWEPLTFARSDDARLRVERFGSMQQGRVFFTVLNDSAETVRASLRVPLDPLALPARDLAVVDEIAGQGRSGRIEQGSLLIPLELAPQAVALLHLARTNDLAAFHLEAAAQLFRQAQIQRKADEGRPERPVYWLVNEARCSREAGALQLRNADAAQTASASQWVMLFQKEARPITIRTRVKTQDLTGGTNRAFALQATLCYVDRQFTTRDPRLLPLEPGDGAWRNVTWTLEPDRPVRSLQLELRLQRRAGTAWFDDVSVRSADEPGNERVVDGGFDAWYERLAPDQARALEPAMAAARQAVAEVRSDSLKSLAQSLSAMQSAAGTIVRQRLENPARRELRDLAGAQRHLALAGQTLAGIYGLELVAPATAVPGETLSATARLVNRPGVAWRAKMTLDADQGVRVKAQPQAGETSTFAVEVPSAAAPGTRCSLRVQAAVALADGVELPLQAERALDLIAPFAARIALAGLEANDTAQLFTLHLTNHLARPQPFALASSVPADWTLKDVPSAITVAPRATMSVPFSLIAGQRVQPGRQEGQMRVRGAATEQTLKFEWTHRKLSPNLLKNPGFEDCAEGRLSHWSRWEGGYDIDDRAPRSGARSVRLKPDQSGASVGASQGIILNQTRVAPLIVRGWSKAEKISPGSDGYCLYVDVYYTDGTKLYGQKVPFAPGTHDWQFGELRIETTKPARTVTVYAMLRGRTGTAWFDDVLLAEELDSAGGATQGLRR